MPQVYLHDEITTDGYAKCIIELMTLHGILIKKTNNNECKEWILGPKWDPTNMVLCLDGLSSIIHQERELRKKEYLSFLSNTLTKKYQEEVVVHHQ